MRTKVGRKGYLILPKRVREAAGIEEGDEVIIEVRDGILIRPAKRVDTEELRKRLRRHSTKLKELGVKGPTLGELASVSLEDEFDESVR